MMMNYWTKGIPKNESIYKLAVVFIFAQVIWEISRVEDRLPCGGGELAIWSRCNIKLPSPEFVLTFFDKPLNVGGQRVIYFPMRGGNCGSQIRGIYVLTNP